MSHKLIFIIHFLRLVADTRCKWSVDGNRTCYKLVHEKMTWSESRTNCQNLGDGADLVSIESQEENEFLLEMIRGKASTYATTPCIYNSSPLIAYFEACKDINHGGL